MLIYSIAAQYADRYQSIDRYLGAIDSQFRPWQSFVAGAPTNIQFMVKDSTKYASTGGWGFGHFNSDEKTVDDAFMKSCFPCHQKMKERDLVVARYAP